MKTIAEKPSAHLKRLLLLAGEESGLLYARGIAEQVRMEHPGVEIRGYADYGFQTADLAVIGFAAVIGRLFFFLRVKRTMERAIAEWNPDAVCTVDYPGMNLKLAAFAKKRGIRAVHVVCPQVWAWRKWRIPKIEQSLDHLCCFFPFEPELFSRGFATFVGHPLVDAFTSEIARKTNGRGTGGARTLAVLPGSRMDEIERHLPVMLSVVQELRRGMPDLAVVIPAANPRAYSLIHSHIQAFQPSNILLRLGGAREVLLSATAAVVASGTATLEAAIANCPTVLVYRVGVFFAWLMRHLLTGVRHVGLANIIAEKAGAPCPMPELLQDDFTAENVLSHLRPWLQYPKQNEEMRRLLADTMKFLQSDGDSFTKIASVLI